MNAMTSQIGPVRMHKETMKALKAAAKKAKVTASEYMRLATQEKMDRESPDKPERDEK